MTRVKLEIIKKPAFNAVGYKWQGTFEEAGKGGIHALHVQMKENARFVQPIIDPDVLLGINHHNIPGGFTHYIAVEVSAGHPVLDCMESLNITERWYARHTHERGEDITSTYEMISDRIRECGYRPLKEENMEVYDQLPIKLELYKIDLIGSEDPEFEILIPIESGSNEGKAEIN
ncbi:hypothetical protein SRABI96_02756 [Peribacillus sp. Bi96]|uniref:GyrI-like domain-containing protein n=1 Tax=Peribacillus sp. Bi96 TaxID=2884273 RepID=UPI001D57A0A2|nr:effector binding domain-containing protein [Peribacillus sp. Bi96]CAH0234227.1 hypothetical protein SRABI96_02756 [Peribacillus sp. Bi96]